MFLVTWNRTSLAGKHRSCIHLQLHAGIRARNILLSLAYTHNLDQHHVNDYKGLGSRTWFEDMTLLSVDICQHRAVLTAPRMKEAAVQTPNSSIHSLVAYTHTCSTNHAAMKESCFMYQPAVVLMRSYHWLESSAAAVLSVCGWSSFFTSSSCFSVSMSSPYVAWYP